MIVPMSEVLGLSAVLFGIGVFGFLARRNIILVFVSVEVMLNAVNLSLQRVWFFLTGKRIQFEFFCQFSVFFVQSVPGCK